LETTVRFNYEHSAETAGGIEQMSALNDSLPGWTSFDNDAEESLDYAIADFRLLQHQEMQHP